MHEIKNKDLHNRYWEGCLEIVFQGDLLNKNDKNIYTFTAMCTPDL